MSPIPRGQERAVTSDSAATFDTPGGRTYALNMLKLGLGRLLPPEAHTSIGAWIDELLALVAAQAEQLERVRALVTSWPDGNERASDYASARGQCKRAVLKALDGAE